MAVATTPYTQNDYQSANTFRPYNLPINDIFKAISAQNKYWDDGAALVKSKYEDALGMDLTSDANKEFRDNYLKEAEKQLTKLSTKNLADRSVQREGLNLFKPLLQDKALKIDSAITTKLKDIYSTAESYKGQKLTKDGRIGEGYDDLNLGYALKGFEKLNPNTPRDEKYLEQLYKELGNKAYTPFVDVSQEYLKLKDKCKSSSTSVPGSNAGYIITNTTESLEANTLTACIKGGLSDAAWNQLKITGYMKLQGDPATIAQMYKPTLVSESKGYAKQIIDAQNERDGLKKSGKLTPELEKAYENYIKDRDDSIKKNDERVASFDAGDYSYISNDLEGISQRVWADYDINSFSQPNAWKNTKSEMKADPVAMQQINIAEKQKDRDMDFLTAILGTGKGAGSLALKDALIKAGKNPDDFNEVIGQGLTPPVKVDVPNVLSTIDSDVEKKKATMNNDIEGIYTEIKSNITDPIQLSAFEKIAKKSDGTIDLDAISNYVDQNVNLKDNKTINSLKKKAYLSQADALSWVTKKNVIDEEVAKSPELQRLRQAKDDAIEQTVGKLGDNDRVSFYDPNTKMYVAFDKVRLKSIMIGQDNEYKYDTTTSGAQIGIEMLPGGAAFTSSANSHIVRKDNGVVLDDMEQNFSNIGASITGMLGIPGRYNPVNKLPEGFNYVRGTSIGMNLVGSAVRNFNEEAPKHVTETIEQVVQHQSFNVNTPITLAEIIQVVTGYVPLLDDSDKYMIRSLSTRKGPDGSTQANIQVLKKNEKTKEFEIQKNSDIFTEENLKNSTVNDGLSRLTLNGENVWVTTSLDKYKEKSPYFTILENQMAPYKNLKLSNREQKDLPGRPIGGGKTLGVTMIGDGVGGRTYRIYLRNSDGKRTFSDEIQETSNLNDIANKLQEIYDKTK